MRRVTHAVLVSALALTASPAGAQDSPAAAPDQPSVSPSAPSPPSAPPAPETQPSPPATLAPPAVQAPASPPSVAAPPVAQVPAPPPAVTPSPPAAQPPAPPSVVTTPQPPAPHPEDRRYSAYQLPDGNYVRLDGRTGQILLCGHSSGTWTCRPTPDERAALESEIGRLQSENAALKRELLERGIDLPAGAKPPPPVAQAPERTPGPELRLPSDAELNRVFAFMERVWKRMVEMMAALQKDIQRKG